MGLFQRKAPTHLISVSPDNAASEDWIILLEAGTIVGPSPDKLRVARSTQEKKIVKKYDLLLRAKHFLYVEGYDPRIHAVYFCPQLYKYDPDKKLVPLQGEEIGRLIAPAAYARSKPCRWFKASGEVSGAAFCRWFQQPVSTAPTIVS